MTPAHERPEDAEAVIYCGRGASIENEGCESPSDGVQPVAASTASRQMAMMRLIPGRGMQHHCRIGRMAALGA